MGRKRLFSHASRKPLVRDPISPSSYVADEGDVTIERIDVVEKPEAAKHIDAVVIGRKSCHQDGGKPTDRDRIEFAHERRVRSAIAFERAYEK